MPTRHSSSISRRDFLKLAGAGLGSLAHSPFSRVLPLAQFPQSERLGRVCVYPYFYTTEIKTSPNQDSATVKVVEDDEVVEWIKEVVGGESFSQSKRWVETPDGYIYAPFLQPVRNLPNVPLSTLPEGVAGFWAEVTVPYVDISIENRPPISPGFRFKEDAGEIPRIYYSQVFWIDQIKADDNGKVLYRVNEDPGHGYGYGDIFWVDASAFRPLTEEEVTPISPDADPNEKKIVIDVTYQTLSCYEGSNEIFFCRVSTGAGENSTPVGPQMISWKIISLHMAGNTVSGSGWDTPGVSWSTFFNTNAGAAIHATFWHNDFGVRKSHGCVNVRPEDAKWIFRWTLPYISLGQSEMRLQWPDGGTRVDVVERSY